MRLGESGDADLARWAERDNLAEMRRVTVAVRRRESMAVLPEVFADFLLRRQHVHPSAGVKGSAGSSWSRAAAGLRGAGGGCGRPRSCRDGSKDYRPAWLDDYSWGEEPGSGGPKAAGRDEPRGRVLPARVSRRVLGPNRTWPSYPHRNELGAGITRAPWGELRDRSGADLGRRAVAGAPRPRRAHRPGPGDQRPIRPVAPGIGVDARGTAAGVAADRAAAVAALRIRPPGGPVGPEGRWWRLIGTPADAEARLLAWAGVLWIVTAC